jgi:SpoVK/Ycf46/Vps4 family AAA+-type ATPase
MADVIRDLLFGGGNARRELLEAVVPRRSFDDVILPPATRRTLAHALTLIHKHDLIFDQWGLGERHDTGLGLAFNLAGPPGTGKTICAEAIAHALGRPLLVVRYAEVESMWAGQTAKYVAAVFREAAAAGAVLLFDEADAIAARRFTELRHAYEREANAVVNVLLHELERHTGVVIFATNLAINLDPAFERRIRTHILFERPGPAERAAIWRVQLHPTRTPLAADVDFDALAAEFDATGGQIKNAVLKAAQIASAEPGPDAEKQIHQLHFRQAMEEVLAAERVMRQSLYDTGPPAVAGRPAPAFDTRGLGPVVAMALAAAAVLAAVIGAVAALALR